MSMIVTEQTIAISEPDRRACSETLTEEAMTELEMVSLALKRREERLADSPETARKVGLGEGHGGGRQRYRGSRASRRGINRKPESGKSETQ